MKKLLTKKRMDELQEDINDLFNYWNLTHGLTRALRRLTKEVILCQNLLEGIKTIKNQKDKFDTTKIQVGGGSHLLEGFLNIDIVPPADIIFDVREGLPFANECVEFIFNEHFLEHIDYPISVKRFVSECYRILKPGGQVVTGVPDSELIIQKYSQKDKKFFKKMFDRWYSKRNCLAHFNTYIDLLNYHFRDQDDNEKYTPHLWAYDFEKLESLFKEAGFSKVKPWKFDKSIANPKRQWGSLYIISTK